MADDRPMESPARPGARRSAPAAVKAEASTASLVIDDHDRYSRLRLISWWRQERLRSARILVVGAVPWATRS